MSEEEIIEILNSLFIENHYMGHGLNENTIKAIQGLLDLYNKEKEKNLIFKGATIVSDLENDGIEIKMNADKLVSLYLEEKEKNQQLFNEYNKRVATIIKYEQGIKYFLDETNISDIEPWSVYRIGGNLLFELEELLEEK